MNNLKSAARQLRQRPLHSIIIITILAIGIGAATGIFSLFHQVLIRPLPVPEPEGLINLASPPALSYPMFRDLEAEQTVFSGLAAGVEIPLTLSYRDTGPTSGTGMAVSGEYFDVLRLQPTLGRLIGPQDEPALDESRVAVLSYDYWDRSLSGDPDIVGQTLTVNGQALTIVGVAPAGFSGTTFGVRPQVFLPLSLWFLLSDTPRGIAESRFAFVIASAFGRLQPNIRLERASVAINALHSSLIEELEPNAPAFPGMRSRTIVLESGATGQRAQVAGTFAQPLTLLLGVTLVVLLVVCSNVANLLLARGSARGHEMAIRMAIGAGRGRLASQVLTEALLLAVIGGIASVAFAKGSLSVIASFLPQALASELSTGLSSTAMLFAIGLSLSTVLLFGLAPAVQAARSDSQLTMRRRASRSLTAPGMKRFRHLLATFQIGFSLALLVIAALFAQSLVNVTRLNLGIDVESVVTFSVSPARNGYDADRVMSAYRNIEEALAAQPNVSRVASATIPLIAGRGAIRLVQGFDVGPELNPPTARANELSAGFFRTVGVPLLGGRDFAEADTAASPRVVIVNESFARSFNLGDDVIGRRFRSGTPTELEIVGLVADAATSGSRAKEEVGPQFYLSVNQIDPAARSQSRHFYVRSSAPDGLVAAIPRILTEVEPNLPVDSVRTLEGQFETDIYIDRLVTTLAGSFAILTALLAGIGLYGTLSYTVAQRTHELGLRLALGAIPEQLRRMILKQVGVVTLVGGILGIAGALALGKSVDALLFGTSAVEPLAFAAAVMLLVVIALLASYLPVRRASSVAPMEALRYE